MQGGVPWGGATLQEECIHRHVNIDILMKNKVFDREGLIFRISGIPDPLKELRSLEFRRVSGGIPERITEQKLKPHAIACRRHGGGSSVFTEDIYILCPQDIFFVYTGFL